MINKAIILCGGTGSRMFPVTKSINKQVLPLFGKPMFFYPLSLLMLCGIRKFLFIINRNQKKYFTSVIGQTKDLGISIKYKIQNKPKGLPEAFIIGKKFIANDSVAMILGDNFFYGSMLSPLIKESFYNHKGANIYLYPSKNTSAYGVVELEKNGSVKKIVEKPKFTKSDLVITGMYVFDKNVSSYAKKLKPSKRGETEIVDLINFYKRKKLLNIIKLGRGCAWLDVGNFEDLHNSSIFIQNIEHRQNYMIACLEEISLNNKWITKKNLVNRIKFFGNSSYSKYLKDLLKYQ
jgi:glucose-1-phosphate thymidylyltransferase